MPHDDPLHVDLADGVGAVFLPRQGGLSGGRYASLNLGLHVGDDADRVLANRRTAAEGVGVDADRVTWAEQVHGAGVAVVEESAAGRGAQSVDDALPAVDALVTTGRGLPVAALVADCVPVLLASADGAAVGAAHAGRRGLLSGVVRNAVAGVRALAGAGEVRAAVGPHIGPCCYEVGSDVLAEATGVMPVLAATSSSGRPSLDLTAGVRAALADAGVADIDVVGGCTACQAERWFSFRRDGVTGRMAGLVWRR